MSYYDNSTAFGNYLAGGADNEDAWALIEAYLQDAGLEGLSGWAQQQLVEYGSDMSQDQFNQRIRETQEYKKRFQAIELAKKEGRPAPTEAEVLATEKSYRQLYQQAGLPESFYDEPEDFARMISRGISPAEVQSRLLDGIVAIRNDSGVQAQMNRLYEVGMNEGDTLAYFLDPEKATSILEKRQAAATIAARSASAGFGDLTQTQAESLAGQGLSDAQARSGFGQLAQQRSLLQANLSEQGNISQQTALDAAFGGNADADRELTRRRAERQSRFSGGGSYVTNNRGATGAGSSS